MPREREINPQKKFRDQLGFVFHKLIAEGK